LGRHLINIERHNFENCAAAAAQAAARIAAQLSAALHDRGRATLVIALSAESLPILEILLQADIDWNFVTITLADECYVPLDDARSREAGLRMALAQTKARDAQFVGLYVAASAPELAAFTASSRISRLPRPFDCALLDMDNQGQTAGFLKGGNRLKAALARDCRALVLPNYVRSSGETYLTMTLPLLADTALLILPISGKRKLLLLEEALNDGSEEELPVRAMLKAAKAPVQVYWYPE